MRDYRRVEKLLIAAHIKLGSESSEADPLTFDAACIPACSSIYDARFELAM